MSSGEPMTDHTAGQCEPSAPSRGSLFSVRARNTGDEIFLSQEDKDVADMGMKVSYVGKVFVGVHEHRKAVASIVAERKIGSLGFKIRRGCSYHGLSLNVDCDLTGFQTINPCGYAGLEMVRLSDLLDTTPSMEDLYQKCQQFITEKQIFANISVEADQ